MNPAGPSGHQLGSETIVTVNFKVAVISVEYLRVRVTARENGAYINPTSDNVEFGFTPIHVVDPTPDEWFVGDWETDNTKYYARVLVGPGTDVDFLEQGETYNLWIKIHDNPETPAHLVGTVYVY